MNNLKGTKTKNNLGAMKIKGDRHTLGKVDLAETQKELREVLHRIGVLELSYRLSEDQEIELKKLWDLKLVLKARLDTRN